MKKEKYIGLAIVDDDKLVVKLLADFIEKESNIKVVLQAFSGREFMEAVEKMQHLPEVVLLDLRMADVNGLEVLNQLHGRHEEMKIIVLSTFYKPLFMGQMLKMGVSAFLPKNIDPEEMVQIIEEVARKGHYFSAVQVAQMRKQLSSRTPEFHLPQKDGLTRREIEILQYFCQQLTNQEMAKKLHISVKTIESHKTNLIVKTGVKNSAGLIIYAVQNKLINPEELVLLED